jgi:hypothetical protein
MIIMTVLAIGCAAAEAGIPKDAKEVEPGLYKYTDSTGKTYKFRKTPFGVVRSVDEPGNDEPGKKSVIDETAKPTEPAKSASSSTTSTASPFGQVKPPASAQAIKVVENGDTLEFERPSPFGSYKWKAKKDALTPSEREAWDRSRQQTTTTSGPKE